jgi:hypothetical protein
MPDERVVLPGVTAPPLAAVRRGGAQTRSALPPTAPGGKEGRRDLETARDALAAALRRRVGQRAVREHGSVTSLAGHSCEICFDAPAIGVQPAPWGGEMGGCGTCAAAGQDA